MRVLATNISAGLTAATLAAAALVGFMATGLTSSPAQAAAMQDHLCATAGSQCRETTGTPSRKKSPNLAARALSNKVLMDVMLGNAKSNPDLTVGCGVSGICVTLIPEQPDDPDHVGVPGVLTLTSDSGSGPQSFSGPFVDTAFIAGSPATSSFASIPGRGSPAGRFVARAASPGSAGTNGPSSGGGGTGDGGSNGGGGNGGGGNGGGGNGGGGNGGGGNGGGGNGGGEGDNAGNGNPDENGNGDGPNVSNPGPQDPIIVVFEPADPIRVPEPSTLFIFGFALLVMAGFGARQTQAATNHNQAKRARR